ncbi:MAG: pantoate--beta-alanine ligase [Candidatus Latescibacteria bacterium]|nr:pantoate--beta-alanine ligase [Candidatus Latescibacterota bacterium]
MPPHPEFITQIDAMHTRAEAWRRASKRIGLVPTMGALHRGHFSLIEACQRASDLTVVSIFVNPMQFGPREDYTIYPRDLDSDLSQLARLGVEAVFHPQAESMYPSDFATIVEVEGLSDTLCGPFRPGHFRGVTTVVTKLFNAVKPHLAVFGQKDYQQAQIIRRMIRDLSLDIDVLVAPTIRQNDGLALSSRNANLTPEEIQQSPLLYKALEQGAAMIAGGEKDAAKVSAYIRGIIEREVTDRIDYVSIVDPDDLSLIEQIQGPVVIALAVHVSRTRLIDNIKVDLRSNPGSI